MTDNINNNAPSEEQSNGLEMKDLFFLCLSKWYWFVVSIVLFFSLGYLHYLRTVPVYTRTATLLIKDSSSKRGASSVEDQISALGGFTTNSIQDEVISLQSPAVTEEVVRRLHLDIDYLVDGTFHNTALYGKTLPLEVRFLSLADEDNASFDITYDKDGNFTLTNFAGPRTSEADAGKVVKGKAHKIADTPVGRVLIDVTPYFYETKAPIHVRRTRIKNATRRYNRVDVALCDKQSNMLNLTFHDANMQRAEDVINATIEVYNENWITDKNQVAVNTAEFINERLRMIESELGSVDRDISSYKSSNMLPDAEVAASTYMSKVEQTGDRLMELNNQLSMAKFVRDIVADDSKTFDLLPANSGINASSIEKMISEYNESILLRNRQVANSSVNSPTVAPLEERIVSQRRVILQSIDNLVRTLTTQITNLREQESQINSKIASNPQQASYLTSIGREQKVKESLYIFLLQKREESELSKAYTASNTRIITPPTGSDSPSTPVKRNILLIALAIGVAIPLGIIYLLEILNTTVRGRRDIEHLAAPYIGEIPLSVKRHNLLLRPLIKGQKKHDIHLDVAAQNTNFINEAFRVVRANFEFVVSKHGKGVVTMVTSANVSSGKTYLSSNLAASLAIKNKRVCVVDLDLRKATVSRIVRNPKIGITNYLVGQCSLDDIKHDVKEYPGMTVIPVGTIPPNPAELLYDEKIKEVLDELRQEYDYIFLDCPPVEIVADASIIKSYADATLFVLRAHLMERSLLPDIDKYYTEQRYPNMIIVLNGTDEVYKSYSYRRYGYQTYGNYGNTK